MVAALAAGAGAGCLDGGANGLVLDVYREGRGRAMNLLHLSFSIGALAAPLTMGALVESGVPWQTVAIATGAVISPFAVAYAIVPMPSGRRSADGAGTRLPASSPAHGDRRLLAGPLLLLGIAIATYVASEVGVSSWLVRFLEPAPLTTATLALSLYWAGLAVGRLVSSAIADRFDHLRFTIACTLAMGVLIAAAVLVPSLPLSMAAFAAAGVASGPVFPMIIAIGGERYPERSAAVGGSLTAMAVIGSVIYPPAMGFMSVTIGLTFAMLGNAFLAIACVLALVVFGRATGAARPRRFRAKARPPEPRRLECWRHPVSPWPARHGLTRLGRRGGEESADAVNVKSRSASGRAGSPARRVGRVVARVHPDAEHDESRDDRDDPDDEEHAVHVSPVAIVD
jgi:fucose permease